MSIKVRGSLAEVTLDQKYLNDQTSPIEAEFTFPIDPLVTISSMVLKIESKEIEGRVELKEEAKRQYNQALAQGDSAALATQQDEQDMLQFMIGNIPAGQEAHIVLKYTFVLSVENGHYALNLPTSYFPRAGEAREGWCNVQNVQKAE